MLRRFVVLAAAAATALVLFPIVPAAADTIVPKSRTLVCYGIKTKGAHKKVLVTVEGKKSKKGYVAGLGTLAVADSSQCRRNGNGVKIVGLTIFKTQLKNSSGSVLATGPRVSGKHQRIVGSATKHAKVACRARLTVYMRISYSYSDQSFTRPFWVHSPTFTRC